MSRHSRITGTEQTTTGRHRGLPLRVSNQTVWGIPDRGGPLGPPRQSKPDQARAILPGSGLVLASILVMLLVSGCVQTPLTINSDKCRGFPFAKKFPGKGNRSLWIRFDIPYQWATGNDGIIYDVFYQEKNWPRPGSKNTFFYNATDLPHSEREKRYLTEYARQEKEFDRKYAGWIKEKVLDAAEWAVYLRKEQKILYMTGAEFKRKWLDKVKQGLLRPPGPTRRKSWPLGEFSISYPRYLTGDKLPPGLKTPASFFSPDFFAYYLVNVENYDEYGMYDRPRDIFYEYMMTLRLRPGFSYREKVGVMLGEAYSILRDRMRATLAEYVLTYYYLKEYPSRQDRARVAHDLADYYANVAFRATAEAGYVAPPHVSETERCAAADFAARRIHDYIITAFLDPARFQEIRQQYRRTIQKICYDNLEVGRLLPIDNKCHATSECTQKIQALNRAIRRKIEENQERCVND